MGALLASKNCPCLRRVYVCLPPRLLIISDMMWHDMDPYNWLSKFYNFYMRATVGIIIVGVALELKHLTKTSLWYKSAATSTWYTWNTCVARMSSALKMQCYVWTCKACVYDFMSVHTSCRHLFIAILQHTLTIYIKFLTGPAKINHVSENYTELYFH